METTQRGFVVPLLLVVIALLLVSSGAYVYTQKKSANPSVTGNVPVATSNSNTKNMESNQVTIDQIKNGNVPYCDGNKMVTISNGEYFNRSDSMYISLSKESSGRGYAYGDVNGDNLSDLVAIFSCSGGGTGYFSSLYVFTSKDGKPQYITREDIGDRNVMKSISIVNGVIILDILTQGPGDAAANPRLEEIIKFKLVGTKLIKS